MVDSPEACFAPRRRRARYIAVLVEAAQSTAALLVVGMLCILPRPAQASEEMPLVDIDQVSSGALLFKTPVQGGVEYRQAPRLSTDIDMSIVGDIARGTIVQAFENPTSDWVEAIYVFPLPDDAAVDHMELQIGERKIVGEIHRREAAKKIYDDARKAGKKTALLSQERPNLFTTSVANIAPGERIQVGIEYQQSVQQLGSTYRLRIPLTLTPRFIPGNRFPQSQDRRGSGWAPNTNEVPDASRITPPSVDASVADQGHLVQFSASLDAGRTLLSLTSRYHRIQVTPAASTRYDIVFDDQSERLDHDIELEWEIAPADTATATHFLHRSEEASYLFARLLPPEIKQGTRTAPRELILVIDTSGSMQGVSMAQARSAAEFAIAELDDSDFFNIIEFDNSASALFTNSQRATQNNRALAMDWLRGLVADGGTNMAPALALALQDAQSSELVRQVLFVTDGAVGNEEALFQQINRDLGRSRLFTVGIGSAPNGWFMRKAAEVGRGTQTTISAVNEVEQRMQTLFGQLAQPALTDIRFDWAGAAVEAYPETIADLYAGEPVTVAARLPNGDRPEKVTVLATSWDAGLATPWRQEIPLDWTIAEASPGIGVVWARRKIESLADQRRRGGDPDAIRESIATVALAHHLVSEATSLVAVDKTPARTAEQALKQRNVANLKPYGSAQQSLASMVSTATPASMKRISGLLLILLALIGLTWSRIRGLRYVLV
ncbi:MAG: marine proteobacterial sortase target protein [Woeseiaceae bacterium]